MRENYKTRRPEKEFWIPAHKGIKDNELADQLAKKASKEEENRNIQVPLGDLRKKFKKETWNMTQNSITKIQYTRKIL